MSKKIAVLCMAGMSTSLLVNKMKDAAQSSDVVSEICAFPAEKFLDVIGDYDAFLLGPQIRYKEKDFAERAAEVGKPVMVIDMMDYGTMNGKAIFEKALTLFK